MNEQAAAQIKQLQDELLRQWRANHDEHCRLEWPHDDTCYWPRPSILAETDTALVAEDHPVLANLWDNPADAIYDEEGPS